MQIVQIQIASLKPYEHNSRTHDKAQIAKIAASIKEFGFNNPVLIRSMEDLTILAGHGRVDAAKLLGMVEAPCIPLDHLTPAQARAYVIADNALAELSGWDQELLSAEVASLKSEDFDLGLLGLADLDSIIAGINGGQGKTDEDDVPPVPETPITKPRDLWLLGPHRLLCGDATKRADVERVMDGKKADMVFADPPYGMRYDASMCDTVRPKGEWCNKAKNYTNVIGDDEDFDPSFLMDLFKYCKEQFWWGADYYAERIAGKNKGSWIIWDKRAGVEDLEWTTSEFETCWSKNRHHRRFIRIRWHGLLGMEHDDTKCRLHPTQKPARLSMEVFDAWGAVEDIIVDPFLGSGSTLIACEKTGRICYGMEIDPHYCDVIEKRWEDYTGKKAELAT